MLEWLERWYLKNCDGDWEHDQGVCIETLDNPGWSIEIDFNHTGVISDDYPWNFNEKSDTDWIGFSVKNNMFNAAGDPKKLELLLRIFKAIIEKDESEINKILSPYK